MGTLYGPPYGMCKDCVKGFSLIFLGLLIRDIDKSVITWNGKNLERILFTHTNCSHYHWYTCICLYHCNMGDPWVVLKHQLLIRTVGCFGYM